MTLSEVSPEPSQTLLGLFAKHWTPGAVKTRLAASIGPEAAAELYRAFVVHLVERFGGAADTCVLAYSPPQRRDEFLFAEASGWRLWPQSSGDLGARMKNFFVEALATGAERVVLIGSDSPTLPREHVQAAFEALGTNDVVLNPAADGGYCLVGVAGKVPPIFDGIPWSTGVVFRETVARLEETQTPFAVLPPWYDVDDEVGLARLENELREMPDRDPGCRPLWKVVADAVRQRDILRRKNSSSVNAP
jgi:rSAM/selenodomain-associated transferase 1